jgi:hypothetical protein
MERNLNDIIPPSRRRALLGDDAPPYTPPAQSYQSQAPKRSTPRGGGRKFPLGTAIIALIVILLSAGALYVFSKARVTVVPVTRQVSVSGQFIATNGSGALPFAVIQVEKTATKDVKSEGTETVNQAAQGTIVISNMQAVPQQLIKNTRFETSNGLIFRIHDSVTVPASKGAVPGTLSVTIYADATGDGYNVPAGAFTIPGLKGSKAFDLVTAKSTEAMVGGFSGPRPTVAQATKDKEYENLKALLAEQIKSDINAKVSEDYILLPGASFISYVTQPDAPGAGGTLTLGEKVVATVVVFPRAALASSIAYATDGTYTGQSVTITNADTLTLTSATGSAPDGADQEFNFSLEGTASILWHVDAPTIASAVAGKTRSVAETSLTGFPEIDHATLLLRPFWASSFPADPTKIQVVVVEPTSAK